MTLSFSDCVWISWTLITIFNSIASNTTMQPSLDVVSLWSLWLFTWPCNNESKCQLSKWLWSHSSSMLFSRFKFLESSFSRMTSCHKLSWICSLVTPALIGSFEALTAGSPSQPPEVIPLPVSSSFESAATLSSTWGTGLSGHGWPFCSAEWMLWGRLLAGCTLRWLVQPTSFQDPVALRVGGHGEQVAVLELLGYLIEYSKQWREFDVQQLASKSGMVQFWRGLTIHLESWIHPCCWFSSWAIPVTELVVVLRIAVLLLLE